MLFRVSIVSLFVAELIHEHLTCLCTCSWQVQPAGQDTFTIRRYLVSSLFDSDNSTQYSLYSWNRSMDFAFSSHF